MNLILLFSLASGISVANRIVADLSSALSNSFASSTTALLLDKLSKEEASNASSRRDMSAALESKKQTLTKMLDHEGGAFLRELRIPSSSSDPSAVAYYAIFPPYNQDLNQRDTPAVILLTGWGESIFKYHTIIDRLRSRNVTVAALEWPGQGISPSAYPCDTALHQTTEACTTHSELLTEFCSLISSCHHRVSLIAHSMGCLNAIRSSAKFSKSVYVCPLIYPCLPLPPFPAAIVCGFMRRLRGSRTGTIKPRRVRSHVLPRAGITGNVTNLVAWEWIRMEAPELM